LATICAVICASHSPFLYAPPEEWAAARLSRSASDAFAPDLPQDSAQENEAKHARCARAFDTLRAQLRAARPDVLLIFGDDQLEQFDFGNLPAFCVFIGDSISGYRISPYFGLPVGRERPSRPKTPEHWVTLEGHPPLARRLVSELVARRFDVAFSNAAGGGGIGHAFTRPLESLAPGAAIPVVPFYINCYYGPQPTARRCYEIGRAVREIVDTWPADVRVGVIGSGGLWHTPMGRNAYIDQAFDREVLAALTRGDARAMAEIFDSRRPELDPDDAEQVDRVSGGTGMVLGMGSGTGEIRNWIAASAVVDGTPGTVVDYVDINASPVGAGFAYWNVGS
jgi:Catalytic LigB subunit of aromatic ring-opening dioxygenase